MSQQINLLRAKPRAFGGSIWAVAAFGVVLLGLAWYLQSVRAETARLRDVALAGEEKLSRIRASVQSSQARTDAKGDAAALEAEIAALRPRAEFVTQLLNDVRAGNLGSPEGFARYYAALGGVSEPGVWLSSVAVTKGGTSVSISGRALRNESVMQYARRLNGAFLPYGVQFNSLELTPENLTKPGASGAPVAVVAFKLS